jgi:DNA-binding PadR family transcriptional regulator
VSPVFRHGGLRLYLLKLLDEAPRHGYEVIRLLQDRFLGVYAPSPGTIYPRLARLEEEGLVTHDEVDGKKVYRITDKGREEINARLDDLAELEEELTRSVRDIAREVSEDVRETVRNLREELTWAAKDVRGQNEDTGPEREDPRERARRARDEVRESATQARDEARGGSPRGQQAPGRGGQRREWGDWASQWPAWTGWKDRPWGQAGRGWPGGPGLDIGLLRDLERLAVDFANQLRKAAWNTESVGETALGDLRAILEDTLARIKDEVFRGTDAPRRRRPDDGGKDDPERDAPTGS